MRAATLGMIPGAELFRVDRERGQGPPPIIATEFPPIEPLAGASDAAAAENFQPGGRAGCRARRRALWPVYSGPALIRTPRSPAPIPAAAPVG